MKTIGVLGGMGPESTARFYQEIIRECQKQYCAKYDEDYPKIIIFNTPIPDVVKRIDSINKTTRTVTNALKQIESNNVGLIAVPCNTINIIYDEMQNAVNIPVLNIIEETSKKIKKEGLKKIGLIATEATIKYKLYKTTLKNYGITCINSNQTERRILTKIIFNLLAGNKFTKDKAALIKIIKMLRKRGAEGIILGCTELPLLISQKDIKIKIFDTINILAEATVQYATNKKYIKQTKLRC